MMHLHYINFLKLMLCNIVSIQYASYALSSLYQNINVSLYINLKFHCKHSLRII